MRVPYRLGELQNVARQALERERDARELLGDEVLDARRDHDLQERFECAWPTLAAQNS